MSNTALDNIRVRVSQTSNVKVRVQDNGSLQSITPVTLKNAVGQIVTLTELFDVTITDVANSQILAYQSNTGQWINRTSTTIAGNTGQVVVANTDAFNFTLSLANTVTINQSLVVGNSFSTNSSVTTITNGNFSSVNSTSFSANVLNANTLTVYQTSNLAGNTTVGGDLNVTGNINRNPNVNLILTGDISGSGNATLTNLGSVTITVNTTSQGNSVELGVDTTGSYVANIANGTGVFISNTTGGETEVPVIAIGQDVRTNSTVTFASANVTGNIRANNIIIGNGSITAAAPLTIGFVGSGPGSGIKVGEVDFFAFANAGSNRGAPTFR